MDVFFNFIAGFGLFFGIAGLVYSTEISRRCQELINTRFSEIDAQVARKMSNQDAILEGALIEMRRTMKGFEELQQSQSREITTVRNLLDPLIKDLEDRVEQKKKEDELAKRRRR